MNNHTSRPSRATGSSSLGSDPFYLRAATCFVPICQSGHFFVSLAPWLFYYHAAKICDNFRIPKFFNDYFRIMCKILSRINQIAKAEGISISVMERTIGASRGVISRAIKHGTDIQSKWLELICENYHRYSAAWLLTGEGDMLKQTSKPSAVTAPSKLISTGKSSQEALEAFAEATKKTPGAIPLVSEKAIGGFSNEHFSIQERDVLAYYVIPKFRFLGVDFMIEVIGDSMMPKFFTGDIIACSVIHQSKFIQWNKPHLIATREQGLLVKRLQKSEDSDCLLAVSENCDYAPFDIPLDEIIALARVVGVIHIE